MNKKELQKTFPHVFAKKLLQHEDKMEVELEDGTKAEVLLDPLDWECNSPPFSTLWARRLKQVHIGHDGIKDLFVDGPGEVLGVVFICTGMFVPLSEVPNLYYNVPNKTALLRLYWQVMDEITPVKFNIFTRFVQKVVAFFSKKK